MRLFIDTGALAALHAPDDQHHRRATDFIRHLPAGTRLSTSNLVFTETATLLASHHGQDAAIRFAEGFLQTRIWESVHYADEALERAAIRTMKTFRDKSLSFTDATTIALVKSEGLDGVFGFDEDFARCGLKLYPQP